VQILPWIQQHPRLTGSGNLLLFALRLELFQTMNSTLLCLSASLLLTGRAVLRRWLGI